MRNLYLTIFLIGISFLSKAQDQITNGNITAGGTSGIYWSGFKSTGASGKWGFQQNDIMMIGIGGNVYNRGFSTNAMGIFNGSTTKEDVYLYNQNNVNGDFIVLKNTGNVGIGTTNPLARLDIGNPQTNSLTTILARLPEGNNVGNGTYLGVRTVNTQPIDCSSFSIEHRFYDVLNSSIDFHRGLGMNGGFLTFSTNDGTEKMRIDVGGNIGIGTTDTKGYKLAVAGNIVAEAVTIKLKTNWPDYVFTPSYQLPTLKETEQHIKEKGHLPGIPSAAEVKASGVDLGEMNAKLLQKVEELTLYMIELQKQVEDLKKKIK